jgi:hypothetical protein
MHPAREGTIHRINDKLHIEEYNDFIFMAVGPNYAVKLNDLEVNQIRNILSAWKNAKFNRARRAASKKSVENAG